MSAPVPVDKQCKRCGDYTNTGYCSRECSEGRPKRSELEAKKPCPFCELLPTDAEMHSASVVHSYCLIDRVLVAGVVIGHTAGAVARAHPLEIVSHACPSHGALLSQAFALVES